MDPLFFLVHSWQLLQLRVVPTLHKSQASGSLYRLPSEHRDDKHTSCLCAGGDLVMQLSFLGVFLNELIFLVPIGSLDQSGFKVFKKLA